MPGLLGDIFSAGNVARRKLTDLLGNPLLSAQQFVGNLNDRARVLNEMTSAAAQEGVNYGPASRQLAGLLAEAYSPVGMVAPRAEALKMAQKNAAKPISEGGLGLPKDNTAMDRAKAMGFDVDLLHGTDKNLTKFEAQRSITKDHGWYGDEGVYLTPDPNTASGYANWRNVGSGPGGKLGQELYGQNVMPLMVRRGNVFDYGDAPPIMDREKAKEFSEIVKRLGYNTVEVPNKYAAPEYSRNYETLVIDPSRIRSRFAAFDPARIDENDLLAGVLPLSLLADEEQRKKADAYFRSLLGQ